MSATAASLGIETTENVTVERTDAATGTVARIMPIESPLDALQRELDAMKAELEQIRRRDDTLQFYMHRLDEELRLAARVQQDFLPKTMPRVGNVRFHPLFRPLGHVSGDLY